MAMVVRRLLTSPAVQQDLVSHGGILVVVAVPLPFGGLIVEDPESPVPEARLPEHRKVGQLVIPCESTKNQNP